MSEQTPRAILCTANAGKAAELARLFDGVLAVEPMPAATELPPETADSFTGNAQIKARAGRELWPDVWVIADDSGLCVDALEGRPGVHSARYAGEGASDADNVARLLGELGGVPAEQRGAHFACVLVAITPDGDELVAEGRVDGTIAAVPMGSEGFGYDPVFVPEGHAQTFAQLGVAVKGTLSHRARAAASLRHKVRVLAELA